MRKSKAVMNLVRWSPDSKRYIWAQRGPVPDLSHLVQFCSPHLAQAHCTVPSGIKVLSSSQLSREVLKMSGLLFIISYPYWSKQPSPLAAAGQGGTWKSSDPLRVGTACSGKRQRYPGPTSWNILTPLDLSAHSPAAPPPYHSHKVVYEKEEKLTVLYPA